MSACCCGRVSKLWEFKLPPTWITMERGSTVKTGSSTQIFNGYRRSSPGEKWSGCGVEYSSSFSVEDWERVELHLYSPSGPSWHVIEWIYVYCRLFWNVMARAQKSDFFFRRNGRVNLNRRGRQFSRLLAAVVCASAVVILDTTRSEVVWRVLATQNIRQFPPHFPSRASPCAITFQLDSTSK
jgi:hypothetical protein